MATKEDIILTTINQRFEQLFNKMDRMEDKMNRISDQAAADDRSIKDEVDRSLTNMWLSIRKLEKFVWTLLGIAGVLQFLGIGFLYKIFS